MRASLRLAGLGDAHEIVRVLRTSRLRYMPYAPPAHTEAEDLAWVTTALIPSGGVTLAVVGHVVVGVLAVRRQDGVSWIDQLYVSPESCGQGIGTQLLRSAVAALPRPIRLYTFQQNGYARRFYESAGFKPVAFSDGSRNEEGCPDVLYELLEDSM